MQRGFLAQRMRLDKPMRFLRDCEWRQNDGECETEFFQFLFWQAEQKAGGNGRAGARETSAFT